MLYLPTGRTVLQEVVHRAKLVKGLDAVVVAAPMAPGIKHLEVTLQGHCVVYQVNGDENDVLMRYYKVALVTGAKIIMRITADCPMLNSALCSDMLAQFQASWDKAPKNGWHYMSNSWPIRRYPHGWDCEVVHVDALSVAHQEALLAHEREHVTPYIQQHPYRFRHANYIPLADHGSKRRITLDTLDDYITICDEILKDDKAERAKYPPHRVRIGGAVQPSRREAGSREH